jgi:hypothetical protein
MPTIKSEALVGDAVRLLQDEANVHWSEPELLDWLNAGQRAIVGLRPDAYTLNAVVGLETGTKQRIPDNGFLLLNVVRNMGADKKTPGAAVRLMARDVLDEREPDWHSSEAAIAPIRWVYDPRDPKTFYLYPPQPDAPGSLEIVYSASPPEAAASGVISIDDVYANALLDYMLYRAFAKQTEAGSWEQSQSYYASFLKSLGLEARADLAAAPRQSLPAREYDDRPTLA